MLFQAVAATLQTIARDPKHLGAESGLLGVLHTWGQTLHHHPHLHCLVPAGGLALDGTAWIPCPKRFFLPVRVLSRFFRRPFLTALRQAAAQGTLGMQGACQSLAVHQVKLHGCRQVLGQTVWPPQAARPPVDSTAMASRPPSPFDVCPACHLGRMQVQETWFPQRTARDVSYPILVCDTS